MSIILPESTYKDVCNFFHLDDLVTHHDKLCSKLFGNILNDPYHTLQSLLSDRYDDSRYKLRQPRVFNIPKCRTNRFRNSFIAHSCFRKNNEH